MILNLAAAIVLGAPITETAFVVDATRRTPISPYIYGINHPDWKGLGRLATLARQGGNRMTAYNWETNASNAGADYQHQNDGYLGASDEPGWTVRQLLEPAQANGAAVLVTVPTIGHVAADKNADGDVNKTPNYLERRFHRSLARKGARFEFPPNTRDRVVYQDEFVAWLERIRSPKTPVWYSLDNEPDIWAGTHARLVKTTPTYAQIIANNIEYAAAIKAVAPKALVVGPASYGWQGFRRFQDAKDAAGRDFLDVYLAAMKRAEAQHGKRLLDILDIHWYPEARGGGVRIAFNQGGSPAVAAARIQAPRSLWDPTYVEDSWITQTLGGKAIALLPGLQAQIARHYPGTKLGIMEYNYGGGTHISGALAQADVLGAFGRYRLHAACNWGINPRDVAMVAGFRAFRDYDRKGAKFGDLGLAVLGGRASDDSVYAALDQNRKGVMTLVAINKTAQPRAMKFELRGFQAKSAKAFTVVDGAWSNPRVAKATVAGQTVSFDAPALSVTTLEVAGD